MTSGQAHPRKPRNVALLGSTGSIGASTLEVISHLGDELSAYALTAHTNAEQLIQQAHRYQPAWVAISDAETAARLGAKALPEGTQLASGPDAIERVAADPEVDVVVAAIVGSAGLRGAWAALDAGKTVALANKETLVMAGEAVCELARRRGGGLIPVDSEHSAIHQALKAGRREDVRRIVLTASGGPFRTWPLEALGSATVQDALEHPTWDMGPKITIDSATMMNKALEIIEAKWLFDLAADQIEVMIHPQSIVHSLVEFVDGSVVAQLSPPDMKLPIQYALTYPQRRVCPAPAIDWHAALELEFAPPDLEKFPALELGREVAARGGTAGAVLNAANEAAVEAFLAGDLGFTEIVPACRSVLDHHDFDPSPTLDRLFELDRWSRQEVLRWACT